MDRPIVRLEWLSGLRDMTRRSPAPSCVCGVGSDGVCDAGCGKWVLSEDLKSHVSAIGKRDVEIAPGFFRLWRIGYALDAVVHLRVPSRIAIG